MFDNLCDYLHHELEEYDRKVKVQGSLDAHDVQCADILAHCAKNLATYIAMEEAEPEESRGYAYGNYDYSRNRRSMADGGMTGSRRGSSRRGVSRAERMGGMLQTMDDAMDDMPEDLRREAQRFRDMASRYA